MEKVYTYEMKQAVVIVALVLLSTLMFLLPLYVHAKNVGDSIGAPTKEVMTDKAKAKLDAIDAPVTIAGTTPEKKIKTVATTTAAEHRYQQYLKKLLNDLLIQISAMKK